MITEISKGAVIEFPYPFKQEVFRGIDDEGFTDEATWVPGVRIEDAGDGEVLGVADGMGHQILTVIDTYKPAGYLARVFYTRKWRSPNGHEFGKSKLYILSLPAFRRLSSGYRHPFEFDGVTYSCHRRYSDEERRVGKGE